MAGEFLGYDSNGYPIYNTEGGIGVTPPAYDANGNPTGNWANVTGTVMTETDPRARNVIDQASIMDVIQTRADPENITEHIPLSERTPDNLADPVNAVVNATMFNNPNLTTFNGLTPRYDTGNWWQPSWDASDQFNAEGYYTGDVNFGSPGAMTNTGIAGYGIWGPSGQGEGPLAGITQGAEFYQNLNSAASGTVQGGTDTVPLTLGTGNFAHVFPAQTDWPAIDVNQGLIDATTGYFREGFVPTGATGLQQPASIFSQPVIDTPETFGPYLSDVVAGPTWVPEALPATDYSLTGSLADPFGVNKILPGISPGGATATDALPRTTASLDSGFVPSSILNGFETTPTAPLTDTDIPQLGQWPTSPGEVPALTVAPEIDLAKGGTWPPPPLPSDLNNNWGYGGEQNPAAYTEPPQSGFGDTYQLASDVPTAYSTLNFTVGGPTGLSEGLATLGTQYPITSLAADTGGSPDAIDYSGGWLGAESRQARRRMTPSRTDRQISCSRAKTRWTRCC